MPSLDAYKPRQRVFINLRYKHAVLTKVALIGSLLFVATWFAFFSQLSFGFPVDADGYFLPSDTGNTLQRVAVAVTPARLLITPSPPAANTLPSAACIRSVASPTSPYIPKLSVGEAYASLIATATPFSVEPPILPGNLGLR